VLSVAAVVILCDRLTKAWAERELVDHPIDVIQGVLRFRYATNAGGAFSLGERAPMLFAVAAIVMSVVIVVAAFRERPVLHGVALGLILGGAIGNLIDRATRDERLLMGRVVDFIDLHVWPVFNLADAAIVIGAGLLAFQSYREGRAGRHAERAADGA
jgi:signal peptidase II